MTRRPFIVVCPKTGRADIRAHKDEVDGAYFLRFSTRTWVRYGRRTSRGDFPYNKEDAEHAIKRAPPIPADAVWGPEADEPKEVTASVEPAPPDSRPEPPKGFPTMYVLTWWEWWYDSWKREWKWKSQCSMFPMDRAKSIEESAILTAKGFRSVRIVTIPGDPPNA